jgi:DNA-binding HxlR family transcriptional regulator
VRSESEPAAYYDPLVPGIPVTSVWQTLSLFKAGWDLQVIREAFFGVQRFDDFQRALGIGRGVLAERLRNLVDEGILERRKYHDRPERFEYVLTEKGRDLYPIFLAMMRWGERWLDDAERTSIVLTHVPCGHQTLPVTVCEHCGQPVDAREMRYELA